MTSVKSAAIWHAPHPSETDRIRTGNCVAADIGTTFTIRWIQGDQEISSVLKRHGADHPVHEFDFSLARIKFKTADKYVALIESSTGSTSWAVPVLKYDSEILLLNNYILLPEAAMASLLAELTDRFGPKNIRTQRNYNDYSIFGARTEFTDGYLAVFDGDFESYLNGLGKKTRFNLRYYDRQLLGCFPSLETEFVAAGKLHAEQFAEFIELVGKRYDRSYWTGFLAREVFPKFRDSVACTIVRIEGRVAAFNIFFVYGNCLIFTGNTFDEAYSKYSLGFVTTFRSIRQACEQGYSKVILGPGDFGYKSRLSNAKETLYQYSLH